MYSGWSMLCAGQQFCKIYGINTFSFERDYHHDRQQQSIVGEANYLIYRPRGKAVFYTQQWQDPIWQFQWCIALLTGNATYCLQEPASEIWFESIKSDISDTLLKRILWCDFASWQQHLSCTLNAHYFYHCTTATSSSTSAKHCDGTPYDPDDLM